MFFTFRFGVGGMAFGRKISGSCGEGGEVGGGQRQQGLRRDGENVVRGACGGPDLREIQQAGVKIAGKGRQMAHRGDAADGKAGLRTNLRGLGATQGFARQSAGLIRADLIAACGQKQAQGARRFATKQDGFHDLIQRAIGGMGRLGGGAGFGTGLQNIGGVACGKQGSFDAGEAFAHLCTLVFRGKLLRGAGGGARGRTRQELTLFTGLAMVRG